MVRKNPSNGLIGLALVALIGVGGYLLLRRTPEPPVKPPPVPPLPIEPSFSNISISIG